MIDPVPAAKAPLYKAKGPSFYKTNVIVSVYVTL